MPKYLTPIKNSSAFLYCDSINTNYVKIVIKIKKLKHPQSVSV